jgi:hypothetical protein
MDIVLTPLTSAAASCVGLSGVTQNCSWRWHPPQCTLCSSRAACVQEGRHYRPALGALSVHSSSSAARAPPWRPPEPPARSAVVSASVAGEFCRCVGPSAVSWRLPAPPVSSLTASANTTGELYRCVRPRAQDARHQRALLWRRPARSAVVSASAAGKLLRPPTRSADALRPSAVAIDWWPPPPKLYTGAASSSLLQLSPDGVKAMHGRTAPRRGRTMPVWH